MASSRSVFRSLSTDDILAAESTKMRLWLALERYFCAESRYICGVVSLCTMPPGVQIPKVTWISGLVNPQSFLTAICQVSAALEPNLLFGHGYTMRMTSITTLLGAIALNRAEQMADIVNPGTEEHAAEV